MNARTYNAETNSIIEITPEGETITTGLQTYHARWFTIQHLHWNGCYNGQAITPEEYEYIYNNLADGFDSTPGYFDWSHIRDSSDSAFFAMADFIARAHWAGCQEAGIEHKYQQMLGWMKEHEISPLDIMQ